jgi:hypothetical protein
MHRSTSFIRFRRLLLVAGVLAGTLAWAAVAVGGTTTQGSAAPDVFERYVATHSQASLDVLERYAAAHPYGQGLGLSPAVPKGDRIVDDWFRDTPSVATQSEERIVDDWFRDAPSPATQGSERIVDDSFRDAQTSPAAVPVDHGFNWGDWAIGIGSGIGLTALLAGGLLITRQLRHRLQTA